MTLRNRFLLFTAALLLAMLLIAWWGMDRLTASLQSELDKVAVRIGQSVTSLITTKDMLADHSGVDDNGLEATVTHTLSNDSGDVTIEYSQRGQQIHDISISQSGANALVERSPASGSGNSGEETVRVEERRSLHDFAVAAVRSAERAQLVFLGDEARHTIPIPDDGLGDSLTRFNQRMLLGLGGLFLTGLVIAWLLSYRITRPLAKLKQAASRVGQGERGVRIDDTGVEEVRDTIKAFNRMSAEVEQYEQAQLKSQDHRHLREVGEIGRGLAHSLRNPLNAIGLAIDHLTHRDDLDKADRQLAEQARQQIDRINLSIQTFLTLANRDSMQSAPVDLGMVIEDIALEIAQSAERGGRPQVIIDSDTGKDVSVDGIETEIRAVLQALIVNAVEATDGDGRVRVSLHQVDGETTVSIHDEGVGIHPDVRDRLFQPHVTTKSDGSGMGLYLSQRIVESRYDGQLTLAPAEGGGTVATVTLRERVA